MRSAFFCLVAAFPLALTAAPAEASRFTAQRPFPLVNVSGEGRVMATPDIAETTAGVTSEAKTSREAAEQNARAMAAVVEAARAAGIAERDIRTARYLIEPVYRSASRNAQPQITGYRATNLVRLRIRDISAIGDVFDKVTAAGATNISGLQFSLSEIQRLTDEARAAAFADARRKAALYARAAGAQLGRAVLIGEGELRTPRPMAMRAASPEAATPVMPGEEAVTVHVTVSFELVQ